MTCHQTHRALAVALGLSLGACGDEGPDRTPSGSGGSTPTGTTPTGTATGTTPTGTTPTGAAGPYEICIAKINSLRATKGLYPYERWSEAEPCADGQATEDEQSGTPHGAFGDCGESSQNECLGSGASGIESCLDMMWAEKDQANCSGCDACADAYTPDCPNCDFYGPPACGHYVNLSAQYYARAACGFSSLGGWAVIDFQ